MNASDAAFMASDAAYEAATGHGTAADAARVEAIAATEAGRSNPAVQLLAAVAVAAQNKRPLDAADYEALKDAGWHTTAEAAQAAAVEGEAASALFNAVHTLTGPGSMDDIADAAAAWRAAQADYSYAARAWLDEREAEADWQAADRNIDAGEFTRGL